MSHYTRRRSIPGCRGRWSARVRRCRCRRSRPASTPPTRCRTSRTCARSGSTATCRSRTSTSTSTRPASRGAEGFHETFLERTTETGRRINFGTIGCALLWSPFYAVADAWRAARQPSRRASPPTATRGRTSRRCRTRRRSTGVLALCLSVAGRAPARPRLALARGTRGAVRRSSVWSARRCSSTCTSRRRCRTRRRRSPSRCSSSSGCACASDGRCARLAALGVAAALMAMVREQDAFFVAGPAVDFLHAQFSTRRRDGSAGDSQRRRAAQWRRCAAFTPQALAYLALNGHIGPSRLVARKMTWTAPHALERRGVARARAALWTPLAPAGAGGTGRARRAARPRATRARRRGALAMTAVQVYVAGSVESWTVAGAFGQRRFVALTAVLVIGLAALLASVAAGGWWRLRSPWRWRRRAGGISASWRSSALE